MKINYPATSPKATDLSHTSDYLSPGSDDFRELNYSVTEIALVDDEYADVVEAKLIPEDKQAQLDFYSFQQQSNSECSPTSPYELICPRLEFDPDRPLLDSNSRPYKFPRVSPIMQRSLHQSDPGYSNSNLGKCKPFSG